MSGERRKLMPKSRLRIVIYIVTRISRLLNTSSGLIGKVSGSSGQVENGIFVLRGGGSKIDKVEQDHEDGVVRGAERTGNLDSLFD